MPAFSTARFPALVALVSQLASLLVSWLLLLALARLAGWHVSLLAAAWLQGSLAAVIGHLLGLSRWWLPINLAFVPGLVLLQDHALPPWSLLVGFLVLLLLNGNALVERVPLYLTGTAAERRLAERLARLPDGFRFIDLGSGLGGTLVRLARAHPSAHFVGCGFAVSGASRWAITMSSIASCRPHPCRRCGARRAPRCVRTRC